MPGWDKVLKEISSRQAEGRQAVDKVRRHYLSRLHKHTKRNVIAYYSGWLSRPPQLPNLEIGDDDKNAFMTAVHTLNRSLGLDLILHTPGGNVAATESLVDYLWSMFDKDVRVIVPQIAMSAGTMIACSAKRIVMGKQSNLGPIDPQFGGIAAQAVLAEFEMAVKSIEHNPSCAPLWQSIIGKYNPTFLLECLQAIEWSRDMVKNWLRDNMFSGDANAEEKAESAVVALGDHASTKTHSRHLPLSVCDGIGLKLERLEDDPIFQDLVLTVHHAFMHTFAQTAAIKIVENHKGVATVLMQSIPQMIQPIMVAPPVQHPPAAVPTELPAQNGTTEKQEPPAEV